MRVAGIEVTVNVSHPVRQVVQADCEVVVVVPGLQIVGSGGQGGVTVVMTAQAGTGGHPIGGQVGVTINVAVLQKGVVIGGCAVGKVLVTRLNE